MIELPSEVSNALDALRVLAPPVPKNEAAGEGIWLCLYCYGAMPDVSVEDQHRSVFGHGCPWVNARAALRALDAANDD